MDIFDRCASQLFQRVALLHSSGLRLWILLCASRVYKSNKFWLDSNVSLVESESSGPLIPLVGELVDSKVISTSNFFFRSQTLHAGDPARCRRTLSPVNVSICPLKSVTTTNCSQVETPMRTTSMQMNFPETISDSLCRNYLVMQTDCCSSCLGG